jgi:hypothetical protein
LFTVASLDRAIEPTKTSGVVRIAATISRVP